MSDRDGPRRFEVGEEQAGERLDVVVAALVDCSRSQAARLIADGRIRVGGALGGKSDRLAQGDVVTLAPAPAAAPAAPAPPVPQIRHRDEHLLVVDKPPDLVVHPGAGHPDGTLVDALRAGGIPLAPAAGEVRPGIVHRLDRDTSGLMVVATTDEAYRGLVRALRHREVDRGYRALVEGRLPSATGRVDAPIGRDPADRKRFACVPDGKPAVTHWEVLATAPADGIPTPVSMLRCRLETGRTHQIRVHLAYAGCPVVGDRTYGARRDLAAALGLDRFFLHAETLGFDHPVTGERVEVTSPLPEDLAEALARCGLGGASDPQR